MFDCLREHQHETEAERDACNAQTHDAISLVKMSQVGFAGPAKIARQYLPGRVERRGELTVVIFSEEQIVPWEFEDVELPETD
jgi:hypothetical protein